MARLDAARLESVMRDGVADRELLRRFPAARDEAAAAHEGPS